MASHRFLFYAPDAGPGCGVVTLSGDEHHHLARVLRIRPGDDVHVTDGRGWMAQCAVDSIGADATALVVTAEQPPAAGPEVVLALALIRKERFAQALEQCVELGVTRVVPFVSRGAHVRRYGAGTLARLRRVAVSAMKQSFRARLTAVDEAIEFDGLIAMVESCERALVGAQGAPRPVAGAGSVLVVVGPEAGLDDDERGALEAAGAVPAGASPHRLRSETAAVALVAALAHPD